MTAGIAGSARAADAAVDATEATADSGEDSKTEEVVAIADAPSRSDEPAPVPVPGTPQPAAPSTASPASPVLTPVLAPAGSVSGQAEPKKEDKFPLSGSVSMSNSLGNGWLAPGYQVQPQWATSLDLGGSASLPTIDFLPKLAFTTGVSFSIANWLDSYTNGGVYSRQLRASDVSLGLVAGELYTEPFTKIRLGANVSGRIPVSITSRHRNLFTTLGLGLPVSWSMPDEQPWGKISVGYTPSARFSIFTAPASTIPCEAGVTRANIVDNPLEEGLLPVAYGREAQILPDGQCVLPGRQTPLGLTNALSVRWGLGDHSVRAGVGHAVGFMTPLANNPDVTSERASGQNFTETTNGSVAYSYTVPVDFDLSITAGLSSSQSPWRISGLDEAGNTVYEPTIPFWDFYTPANNSSSAFVDVSIGL